MRHADRVRDLHLAAIGQAGRDHVLRHVAGRVGRGAVDLRRVLPGEGTAAVPGGATVGVDDDLPAGQAGVADRAADHELPGRIDHEVLEELLLGEELLVLGVQHRLETCSQRSLRIICSPASSRCWVEISTLAISTGRSFS